MSKLTRRQLVAREWHRSNWGWSWKNLPNTDGEREQYRARCGMRWWAQDYAEARGWNVALTPPQRQKGSKRG